MFSVCSHRGGGGQVSPAGGGGGQVSPAGGEGGVNILRPLAGGMPHAGGLSCYN